MMKTNTQKTKLMNEKVEIIYVEILRQIVEVINRRTS